MAESQHADSQPVRQRILLVEDDEEMRSLLADVLAEEEYEVVQAKNGAEALLCLHRDDFAVIVLDKNMPGLSGLDLLPGVRTICPQTCVILITAFGDAQTYLTAMEKGAFEFLFKPFRMEELLQIVRRALSRGDQFVPSPSAREIRS